LSYDKSTEKTTKIEGEKKDRLDFKQLTFLWSAESFLQS